MFPTILRDNHGTQGTLPDGQRIVTSPREDMRAQGFPDWAAPPARHPRGIPEEDDREWDKRVRAPCHPEADVGARAGAGTSAEVHVGRDLVALPGQALPAEERGDLQGRPQAGQPEDQTLGEPQDMEDGSEELEEDEEEDQSSSEEECEEGQLIN